MCGDLRMCLTVWVEINHCVFVWDLVVDLHKALCIWRHDFWDTACSHCRQLLLISCVSQLLLKPTMCHCKMSTKRHISQNVRLSWVSLLYVTNFLSRLPYVSVLVRYQMLLLLHPCYHHVVHVNASQMCLCACWHILDAVNIPVCVRGFFPRLRSLKLLTLSSQ